jgi:hypothetical protein
MTDETINLSGEDMNLIWELAATGPCSLESKPGDDDNWIERAGGSLPNYICNVAKGIMKSGKSKSASIAIAISRIKKWAAGGDNVNADTRAKAATALAQWTALKAKSKAKKVIKATAPSGEEFVILSAVDSFSLDQVRDAWNHKMNAARRAIRRLEGDLAAEDTVPYGYVREVYNDSIIVSYEDTEVPFYRVPYIVTDSEIQFGSPTPVRQVWEDAANDWRVQAR